MTKAEKTRKVWQITVASVSGIALFFLGAAYQAGAQCVIIDANTERSKGNSVAISQGFSEMRRELKADRREARKERDAARKESNKKYAEIMRLLRKR